MREKSRERNFFRYSNRWGDRGGDQRRDFYARHRRWNERYGNDDEVHNDRRNKDQEGWQRVQYKRSRKGSWRDGKKVDIATSSSKMVVESKEVVSFFFTNFPDWYKARDMFDIFSEHGKVVEVFIPARKEGGRKRFGFVRFLNVSEPQRMVVRLDNIFVRGVKIHVNLPRFNRVPDLNSKHKKEVVHTHKEIMRKVPEAIPKKVWIKKKVSDTKHDGSEAKEDKEKHDVSKDRIIPYEVDDEISKQCANAMVGEVLCPGKSYFIQDEFIRQGVFSIKATPMGANLVLLEGVKGEEDFMGFVDEAKDWLFQWFRWIRPWNPKDIDKERVAWIRCFGIPIHAWSADFFSKLIEHVGMYLYSDDNTEKRKAFDVARFLIRTNSIESLNQVVTVIIKDVSYSIKIVEDWCGPLLWSKQVPKDYHSDESTDSESWHEQEEWKDNFEATGDGEAEAEAGDDLGALMTEINRDNEKDLKRIYSHYVETVPPFCDNDNQRLSKELTSASYVNDTGCQVNTQSPSEKVGQLEDNIHEVEGNGLDFLQPGSGLNSNEPLVEVQSYPIRPNASNMHTHKRDKQRKDKMFFVDPTNGKRKGRIPRVDHELKEVSDKSFTEPMAMDDRVCDAKANSSSFFSAGTVLCADSISSSDIRLCNNKFWALQSKSVARKVWDAAKSFGVEGTHPEENYIDLIEAGERRDEKARKMKVNINGAP